MPLSRPPAPAPHAPGAAAHLALDGVSFSYPDSDPDRPVLTDVSFAVPAGVPTGVIGENGSGKSTLLRIVGGLLTPDAGAVTVSAPGGGAVRVGVLHQQVPFAPVQPVRVVLEDAVARVQAAEEGVARAAEALAEDPAAPGAALAYDEALAQAERLQAWQVGPRIETTLAGLGLADLPRERPTRELSGGQRARLGLAALLLSTPDVLVLDEPTNHLDAAAAAHLSGVLREWPGPVLLASHDRAFLDDAVRALVDLDPGAAPVGDDPADGHAARGVVRHTGTFTEHLGNRRAARERWERRYREEQEELRALRQQARTDHRVGNPERGPRTEARASRKFYADRNAKVVSRRVNDTMTRLERLEKAQVRKPPAPLRFAGLDAVRRPTAPGGWSLTAVQVGVEGRLRPVSVALDATTRLLVTGPNGSGKSTLLGLLAGRVAATHGRVSVGAGVRVGLLTQETTLPDPHGGGPGRSARQAYEDALGAEQAERVPLGTFGLLAPREANRPVGALSVGQVRRLDLAILLADPPDVLLLDEPTNHLALGLVSELERAIPAAPGAVVVASHDRWLDRGWTGERLTLGDDVSRATRAG